MGGNGERVENILVTPRREPDGADGITTSPTVPNTSAISRRATGERDMMLLSPRIIDGVPSPVNLYPWFASTTISTSYGYSIEGCGGTLITPEYVLTAAHCFEDGTSTFDGFEIGTFLTSDALNGGQVSRRPFVSSSSKPRLFFSFHQY